MIPNPSTAPDPSTTPDPSTIPSPRFPLPELIGSILDFLDYNKREFLNYGLVSKSWIYPTRKRLFYYKTIRIPWDFRRWKKKWQSHTAESPLACISHLIKCLHFSLAHDLLIQLKNDDFDLVRQVFPNVVRLELTFEFPSLGPVPDGIFSRLYNFQPALKSLTIHWNRLPAQDLFHFICSFPLLEDLHVAGLGILTGPPGIFRPPHLPVLNGTLVLETTEPLFPRELSQLQDTFRFRKIVFKEQKGADGHCDPGIKTLVNKCSQTLEHIDINSLHQLDLSKAVKLRKLYIAFDRGVNREPTVRTLESITSDHRDLEQVFLNLSFYHGPIVSVTKCTPMSAGPALARLQKLRPNCVKVLDRVGAPTDPDSASAFQVVERKLKSLMPEMKKAEIKFDLENEEGSHFSVTFDI